MAQHNRDRGYRRIQKALANLGHELAHGIEAAPERIHKTTWKEFLARHWEQIVATDFFPIEVWTPSGLQRFPVLFSMELSTWRTAARWHAQLLLSRSGLSRAYRTVCPAALPLLRYPSKLNV
jgi:hypothetical protein